MLAVTPSQLTNLLMSVAPVRPIFIWGPPGIGKSAIVEQFSEKVNLDCVSLLGSQLAPEDLIGVPQIVEGKSRFCPPSMIARDEPYVLFLDELNACTPEVQKAFYSLIHDRRIGEYRMPPGSIVIGAGNRKQDKALARPIASALVNRLIHVELQVDADEWLDWANENHVHDSIMSYIRSRPDQLLSGMTQDDTPFSTPRSWHMLSDALHNCGEDLDAQKIQVLASGCLSAGHASQFAAFARNWLEPYQPEAVLSGETRIPYDQPEEATFMLASVRAFLINKLPAEPSELNDESEWLVLQAIELIERTAEADRELVRYFITPEGEDHLPPWFVNEITSMWSEILQVSRPSRFGGFRSSSSRRPPLPTNNPFSRPGSPAAPPARTPLAPRRPFGSAASKPPSRPFQPRPRLGASRSPFARPSPFQRLQQDDDDDTN